MKKLYAMLLTAVLIGSVASAKQLVIDGQQSNYRTLLTASVSHIEYRTEYRDATCSRQVPDGYRQECRYVGGGESCHYVGGGQTCGETPSGRQCHDLPGHQECRTLPGHQECYSVPSYRTEYYACSQPVQVPYTVKDYDLENDVTINVARNQKLPVGVAETLDFSQVGDTLNITSVKSTANVLVLATKYTSEVSNSGHLKRLNTIVNIQLIDRRVAVGAFLLPITLAVENNALKVTSGLVQDPSAIMYELDLRRSKLFKDEVIIQRALTQAEVSLAQNGNQTVAIIDFQKLGILDRISGKKIKIELRVKSNVNLDNVINRQDIPAGIGETKTIESRL